MSRAAARALLLLLVVAAASRTEAQPLGGNLIVNTYTTGNQLTSSVAATPDGSFIVAWSGPGETDDDGIFARRFSSAGAALGSAFRINTYTTALQDQPSVALTHSGAFTVVWTSLRQTGKGLIRARRFTSAGAPLGAEISVYGEQSSDERAPQIASDATGNFVVVWEAGGFSCCADSSGAVTGMRFKSSGQGFLPFRVNGYTTGFQGRPAVAVDAIGKTFVVVWEGAGNLEPDGVFAQRFDLSTASGTEFRVNTYTSGRQAYASVASDASGNFVVVWSSDGTNGGPLGIFGRRFSRDGVPLGTEFRINTSTSAVPRDTSVSSDLAGGFVVAWVGNGQDGSGYSVHARRYDSGGAPLGDEFRVNESKPDAQDTPFAAHSNGRFVVAWRSRLEDGSERAVLARRFLDTGTFADVNGDGAVSVLDVFHLINFLFAAGPPPV
jgi:hypothetical protein